MARTRSRAPAPPEIDPHYLATATLALPYPVGSDPADVPHDILALDNRIEALYGAPGGFASLDGSGLVPTSQLPATIGLATVATTIAGLGTATAGKVGLLRLLPTTANNGGATALPAGTITVRDTSEFAASGNLSTPNGTIAYTGKTATTFTGCTGGTGTLAANAAIQGTSTPASGSYDHVAVIYDATAGKWIGVNTQAMTLDPGNNSDNIQSAVYAELYAGLVHNGIYTQNWRARDAAGLKPQVRFLGISFKKNTNNGTGKFRPSFRSASHGGSTLTAVGVDTTVETAVATFDTTVRLFGSTAWASIPAYTVADIFVPGIQANQVTGSAGDVATFASAAEVRWVG